VAGGQAGAEPTVARSGVDAGSSASAGCGIWGDSSVAVVPLLLQPATRESTSKTTRTQTPFLISSSLFLACLADETAARSAGAGQAVTRPAGASDETLLVKFGLLSSRRNRSTRHSRTRNVAWELVRQNPCGAQRAATQKGHPRPAARGQAGSPGTAPPDRPHPSHRDVRPA